MNNPVAQLRWFHLTPDRLIVGVLALEGILLLSERFRWFPFNEKKGWTVLITVACVGIVGILMLLWFAASLLFRWRFQFSIRSLLVLVVVVAIPCSWLAVEKKESEKQRQAVGAIEKMGGTVEYDSQVQARVGPCGFQTPGVELPAPAWLRNLLGDDFFTMATEVRLTPAFEPGPVGVNLSEIADAALHTLKAWPHLHLLDLSFSQVTDAGLVNLKELTQLQILGLGHTQITDTGIEQLKKLTQLQSLNLVFTQVTDAGLVNLEGLAQLQELHLGFTAISDVGLVNLEGLTHLDTLDLENTQITDAGLEHLKGLTTLTLLNLDATKVTDEGVKNLQRALPNCQITH